MSNQTEADRRLTGLATGHIALQIELAPKRWWQGPSAYRRCRDEYARGYIMGFCDAIFQAADVNDDARCFGLCTIVFFNVFGAKEGTQLAALLFKEMGSGVSKQGQIRGGGDFVQWRKDCVASDKPPPPVGLYEYVTGHRVRRALG